MKSVLPRKYQVEDQIVQELVLLGIGYLSGPDETQGQSVRMPEQLLVDLMKQPSSRVRTALIPLLLEHPEYASFIKPAHSRLTGSRRKLLALFYTAAVFAAEQLGILIGGTPDEKLARLGSSPRIDRDHCQRHMKMPCITCANKKRIIQVTSELLVEFLKMRTLFMRTAIYLLGGSALSIMGNPRRTLDIDYTTDLSDERQKIFENLVDRGC
jgi:hypothetical protein